MDVRPRHRNERTRSQSLRDSVDAQSCVSTSTILTCCVEFHDYADLCVKHSHNVRSLELHCIAIQGLDRGVYVANKAPVISVRV